MFVALKISTNATKTPMDVNIFAKTQMVLLNVSVAKDSNLTHMARAAVVRSHCAIFVRIYDLEK